MWYLAFHNAICTLRWLLSLAFYEAHHIIGQLFLLLSTADEPVRRHSLHGAVDLLVNLHRRLEPDVRDGEWIISLNVELHAEVLFEDRLAFDQKVLHLHVSLICTLLLLLLRLDWLDGRFYQRFFDRLGASGSSLSALRFEGLWTWRLAESLHFTLFDCLLDQGRLAGGDLYAR